MVRSRELCDKGRWAGGRFGLVGPDNAEVEAVGRLGFTSFGGSFVVRFFLYRRAEHANDMHNLGMDERFNLGVAVVN
jgi:hypothetical protein